MKPGRVIDGDEHDARVLAHELVTAAKSDAARIVAAANEDAARIVAAAVQDAARVVAAAHAEAEREIARGQAAAAAARTRDVNTNVNIDDNGVDIDADIAGDAGASLMQEADPPGKVEEVVGLVLRATVPGAALGELVRVDRRGAAPLTAEVVGFRGEQALLLPLGELGGIAPRGAVWRTGEPLAIRCGAALLGRVLDGLGQPIDGGGPIAGERWAVDRPAPSPLARPPITQPLATGVRALDALLTLGRGQRVGLFAAAGVGKSTLLGQIARGTAADVIVACQVGERGRELTELLADELAPARAKTVVVTATSDAPPLVRLRAVHVATAIAEWFRDRRGANVLLLVDSLTRVARAQREVGLSAGEPPARHGYPPSVFALLPRLIERTGAVISHGAAAISHGVAAGPHGAGPHGAATHGTAATAAITAIYTVLVAGNDMDEPIADEVRGLVDGHIVLDRRLAQRGHFPPIDVVASVSRLMPKVVAPAHADAAARVRARLATYDEHRDLIALGAYQAGRDAQIDAAIAAHPAIERLTRQRRDEPADWGRAIEQLLAITG